MPRWEHGSEERLKQAAMELFEEQGFEDTSAVQIAKRARIDKLTPAGTPKFRVVAIPALDRRRM